MSPILLNIPEKIETENLFLHVPRAGFGPKLHEAILDGYEEYAKWLNWPPTKPTVDFIEEQCRKQHADFILRNFVSYVIFEKTTREIVGKCGYPPQLAMWEIPQFGISYFIRKSRRGRGYATEATKALTYQAFNVLQAKKVEIYCDEENTASCRIPEKLNFKLEYIRHGGWARQDGKLSKLRAYALFSQQLPHY